MKNGCHLYNNCFTCPYPDCIEGTVGEHPAEVARLRAIELKDNGRSPEEIAKEIGRCEKTVHRYLGR